ncbi:putative surface protease GP63 [Trypanosoma theileri]|uniref:Leishmanolysin-like peptidase n=1 Tax=Trypanosoma theileri TaxID=67003 RepID=A0A1X0NE39_9TRYP|nr:putative surface protease GP63 [Trypanosoma theileri]ORC80780.1 putative surface protease GP63 [Trypanosoma theileri]
MMPCVRAVPPAKVGVRELLSAGDRASHQINIVSSSDKWEPLRINVSSLDLDDEKKYCRGHLDEHKSYFKGSKLSCREDKKNTLLNEILPAAINLHSDLLLVKQLETPFKVPDFGKTLCSHFTVPTTHISEGVKDAYMVLYVAAGPSNTPFIDNYNTSGNECLSCGERKNIPTERELIGGVHKSHVHRIIAILLLTWMSKRKKQIIIKWKPWKSQMLIQATTSLMYLELQ